MVCAPSAAHGAAAAVAAALLAVASLQGVEGRGARMLEGRVTEDFHPPGGCATVAMQRSLRVQSERRHTQCQPAAQQTGTRHGSKPPSPAQAAAASHVEAVQGGLLTRLPVGGALLLAWAAKLVKAAGEEGRGCRAEGAGQLDASRRKGKPDSSPSKQATRGWQTSKQATGRFQSAESSPHMHQAANQAKQSSTRELTPRWPRARGGGGAPPPPPHRPAP